MRRLTRARAATDDEAPTQATASSEPVSPAEDAQQGGGGMSAHAPADGATPTGGAAADTGATPTEPATEVLASADDGRHEPGRDLPAGVDPAELATAPATTARRRRLRRRLRYLRAVRELLLRDLGGFAFEAHRSEQGLDGHRRLLDAKAARLTALDTEMRELEETLEDPRAEAVLREPGVGGTCPECGELHPSDARFCSRCGLPLNGRAARERARAAQAGATTGAGAPKGTSTGTTEEPKATTASLWGRPKRPDPAPANPAIPPSAQRGGEPTQVGMERRDDAPPDGAPDAPAGGPETVAFDAQSPSEAPEAPEAPHDPPTDSLEPPDAPGERQADRQTGSPWR